LLEIKFVAELPGGSGSCGNDGNVGNEWSKKNAKHFKLLGCEKVTKPIIVDARSLSG